MTDQITPDETTPGDVTPPGTDPATPPAGVDNTDPPENMVPQSRFNEIVGQRNEAQKKLAEFEKAKQEAEQAEALQRGEHEEVIAELQPKAARAEELEGVLETYLTAELETVPDEFRELVPDGDVVTKLAWLTKSKAAGLFTPRQAPPTDAGQTGDKKPPDIELSDRQERLYRIAIASGRKVTREGIAARTPK